MSYYFNTLWTVYCCFVHQWNVAVFFASQIVTCGPPCVSKCCELNKMWRGVSGELLLEWARLMCSQQTAMDLSSACLNWALRFAHLSEYTCSIVPFTSLLLHRRPLQRGHCRSLIHIGMHTHVHDTCCCRSDLGRANLRTKLYYLCRFEAVYWTIQNIVSYHYGQEIYCTD